MTSTGKKVYRKAVAEVAWTYSIYSEAEWVVVEVNVVQRREKQSCTQSKQPLRISIMARHPK